jgi:hypothetical protein
MMYAQLAHIARASSAGRVGAWGCAIVMLRSRRLPYRPRCIQFVLLGYSASCARARPGMALAMLRISSAPRQAGGSMM